MEETKTLEKLIILYDYYLNTRGCGHTKLMIDGVKNYDREKILLAHKISYGKDLVNDIKCDIVSWNNLNKLKGKRIPIAIDNGTMCLILEESIDLISNLKEEHEKLKQEEIDEIIKNNTNKILDKFSKLSWYKRLFFKKEYL